MDFGIFILMQQRNKHKTSHQILRDAIEQTRLADELGFGAAWYAEHHFSNYGMCSSPLTMIAHCAAVTRNIRLGTGIVVAPLYTPARLIADVAMVDQLSNGRLNLGIGSGYQQFEFERFGVKIEDSGAIYNEFLDILPKGLTQKIVAYEGQHLKLPPSSIAVRCLQDPMPPLWITSGNPVTLGRGVREGHNLFVTALLKGNDAVAELRQRLDKVAGDNGKDLDRDVKFGFLRCAYASDSKAEIDAYLDCARFQRRISESLKFRRSQSDDGYMIKEVPSETDPTMEQLRQNLPVGSVNEVIDKMLEEISILRPKHIALQTQLGDFDQKTMLRQIELWGERIIPAIQKELGRNPEASRALPA